MLLLLFLFSNIYADNTDKAIESLIKAGYYQYELDEKVDDLREEYINKYVEKYTGIVYGIVKAIENKKVTFKWKF